MVTVRAASPETTVTDHTTSVQMTVLEKNKLKISQKRWHTSVILALRRQKDQESKVIFGYIKSLRLTLKKNYKPVMVAQPFNLSGGRDKLVSVSLRPAWSPL